LLFCRRRVCAAAALTLVRNPGNSVMAEPDACTRLPDPEALALFRHACALSHFDGRWRTCQTAACRRRRTCAGGPRGAFSRLGLPPCRNRADAGEGNAAGESGDDFATAQRRC